MSREIFLEKNRNIKALNKENSLNLNLTQKARLLPFDGVSDTLNLYDLFTSERDACTKFRFIFDVNPICSNVLYNMKTEIVKDEGSDDCQVILGEEGLDEYQAVYKNTLTAYTITSAINPIDHLQAIRNTEYSHPEAGNFVYHSGLDLFNNHMLRSKSFVHVNVATGGTKEISRRVFNTLFDLKRDAVGENIREEIPNNNNTGVTDIHLYRVDSIMSIEEAYEKHFTEKDGWFGFNNVGYIEIPNGMSGMSVNKLMNNNKACEFIDMYPDRSLYSFIPKRNKYRNRAERNWDYCICYPYESDYEKLKEIMGIHIGGTYPNAIKTLVKPNKAPGGQDIFVFKTMIKHNLKTNDKVLLINPRNLKTQEINVAGIGDVDNTDAEHCFRLYEADITLFDSVSPPLEIWIRKVSNGCGCKYYLRKFRKITNEDGTELNSRIGKLAFGENIYGDNVAEVLYTDPVDIAGLKDNLGRPLTELYFTVVKTNRGHELWYDENKFNDDSIEFSHCFGKVTSGIETIPEYQTYNIRKLHNINDNDIINFDNVSNTISKTNIPIRNYQDGYRRLINDEGGTVAPPVIEDNITEDSFNEFYGDIVELDVSLNSETVLEKVYHRFNTAQREATKNPFYYDLRYDILVTDDYDIGIESPSSDVWNRSSFLVFSDEKDRIWADYNVLGPRRDAETAQSSALESGGTYDSSIWYETYLNNIKQSNNQYLYPGNLQAEGYFYQPHHQIKVRELSDILNSYTGALVKHENLETSTESSEGENHFYVEINTTDDYGYIIGDVFGIYNNKTEELLWGVLDEKAIAEISGNTYIHLKIETYKEIIFDAENDTDAFDFLLTDDTVPMYATYIPKEQKFVWKNVLPISESSDEELNNIMFTNGTNYIQKNINFYVRRQDPFGKNGLLFHGRTGPATGDTTTPMWNMKTVGYEFNKSWFVYNAIEMQNECL